VKLFHKHTKCNKRKSNVQVLVVLDIYHGLELKETKQIEFPYNKYRQNVVSMLIATIETQITSNFNL
jgi:hypothetical protein